jgi:hypothetical protein
LQAIEASTTLTTTIDRRNAMKMSHLANFLMIIVGGAVQEVSSALRRGLRGNASPAD